MKWIVGWFTIITLLLFWPFFRHGYYPVPGNYLIAWYEPWRSDTSDNGHLNIAHKAVADDVVRQIYPFKKLASDLVRKGEWPLWNPYNGAGQPLLATMHPGFLNPFSLFLLIYPNGFGWSLFVVTQPALLGIFMYLYLRKIPLSVLSATLGSTVFVVSEAAVTRYIYGDYIYALTALAAALYLFESYWQEKKLRIWFLPIVITVLIFSVQPQIVLYVLSFFFLYVLFRSHSWKIALFMFVLVGLGLGMAAVQLIPTFELYRYANVTPQSSRFIFERFLLPWTQFVRVFIPNYFGNQGTYNYWGVSDYVETASAIGLLPMFLALVAVVTSVKDLKQITRFFIISTLVTVLLAFNWIFPRELYSLPIPIISTGVPTRIFMLTTFSLSALCAIGFELWLKNKLVTKNLKFLFSFFTLGVGAIIVISFFLFTTHAACPTIEVSNCRTIGLRNTILEICVFVLGLAFLTAYRKRGTWFIPFALIGVISLSGWYNSTKFLPFSSKDTFYPPNELTSEIKTIMSYDRVFGLGEANIATDLATQLRFYDPQYYDPLYLRRYGELVGFANTGVLGQTLSRSDVEITHDIKLTVENNRRRERLFDLLDVRYLIFKKTETQINAKPFWQNMHWVIYQRPTALPRAYFARDYEVIPDSGKLLTRLFEDSFEPDKVVLLEQDPGLAQGLALLTERAVIDSYKENMVTIKTSTRNTRLLLLADNYYPGWKAYIDGKSTKIFRTNYTFRGVVIPAGDHHITFVYDPESLTIGFKASLLSLIFYLGIVIATKRGKLPLSKISSLSTNYPKND